MKRPGISGAPGRPCPGAQLPTWGPPSAREGRGSVETPPPTCHRVGELSRGKTEIPRPRPRRGPGRGTGKEPTLLVVPRGGPKRASGDRGRQDPDPGPKDPRRGVGERTRHGVGRGGGGRGLTGTCGSRFGRAALRRRKRAGVRRRRGGTGGARSVIPDSGRTGARVSVRPYRGVRPGPGASLALVGP